MSFLLLLLLSADIKADPRSGPYNLLTSHKGALYTNNGSNDFSMPVGADAQCLLTDSTQAVGIKWGACSGGSGAPVDAQYWTGAADGTLTQEKNLGALSTGLVLNTAGVPSTYAGSTCSANQFASSTNASGALTCTQPDFSNLSGTVTNSQITSVATTKLTGTVTIAQIGSSGTAASNTFLRGDGVWASPIPVTFPPVKQNLLQLKCNNVRRINCRTN